MIVSLLAAMLLVPVVDYPMADAAMQGDMVQMRRLLADNVDVDQAQGDGSTALHWAAYRDDAEMTRVLLEAGAGVGATTRQRRVHAPPHGCQERKRGDNRTAA